MSENEEKPYTWAQLKEFANSLTDEQLQQTVKIWIGDDESPTDVDCAEDLGEDHYNFYDAEYGCSKSDFMPEAFLDDEDQPKYQTIEEALANEEHVVVPANKVYLHSFL